MGLFNRKKKSDTVDFTKMSDARIPKTNVDYKFEGNAVDLREMKQESSSKSTDVFDPFSGVSESSSNSNNFKSESSNSGGMFGFLDSSSSSSSSPSYGESNVVNDVSEMSDLKIKMRNITSKIEDSSNEVYRLMQRIELLEKKIQRFENR